MPRPVASPVLHAINYLLGELDEPYLATLRQFGGLQSYPSRIKDPDAADYSTGSVGIGATAPIWGALARRYVDAHFPGGGHGRQYSLIGDAELDEGAIWEAVLDPMVAELGEVTWIVDLNRQSLDRIVPNIGATRLGAVLPDTLAAAGRLDAMGLGADVVVITGAGLLFQALQARRGLAGAPDWILDTVFPADRARPLVTVLDGHPHTLSFLAGVHRIPAAHLGVTHFGQSGDLASVYRYHGLDADAVVGAALDLVD
jgi:pyruvate dehydrogenase complex dehydrogenase (E1) component